MESRKVCEVSGKGPSIFPASTVCARTLTLRGESPCRESKPLRHRHRWQTCSISSSIARPVVHVRPGGRSTCKMPTENRFCSLNSYMYLNEVRPAEEIIRYYTAENTCETRVARAPPTDGEVGSDMDSWRWRSTLCEGTTLN